MNQAAYEKITALLNSKGVPYHSIEHEPSKTSDESKLVREKAGYPNTEGAKALLVKLYLAGSEQFATIVLPGSHTLDKDRLLATIPGAKKLRFATPEDLQHLAGVVPGCMPPFAAPIFSDIPLLIVASALRTFDRIGFNAAYLEKSIILSSQDYFSVVTPSYIVDCSLPK